MSKQNSAASAGVQPSEESVNWKITNPTRHDATVEFVGGSVIHIRPFRTEIVDGALKIARLNGCTAERAKPEVPAADAAAK